MDVTIDYCGKIILRTFQRNPKVARPQSTDELDKFITFRFQVTPARCLLKVIKIDCYFTK